MADGINGYDVALYVEDSPGAGTFSLIAGQRDMTIGATRSEIDVSSKDQPEERVLPGRLVQEITFDQLYIPTDSSFATFVDAIRNATQLIVQLYDRDGDTALEEATITVLEHSLTAPDQEAAVMSVRCKVDGAWTTP